MSVTTYRIPEKASLILTLSNTNTSTAGKTVYAYAVDSAGTKVAIGSASGAAQGTSIPIVLDFSLIGTGRYTLEVIADPNETNPVTLVPNSATSEEIVLDVFNLVAIT